MPNVGKVISGQNKKILVSRNSPPPCKCTLFDCPVEGKCETKGVVYQCEVKTLSNGHTESYVGLTEKSFKDIFYNGVLAIIVKGEKPKFQANLIGNFF